SRPAGDGRGALVRRVSENRTVAIYGGLQAGSDRGRRHPHGAAIVLESLCAAAGSRSGDRNSPAGAAAGHHKIRTKPQKTPARPFAPQSVGEAETTTQPEPARAGAGLLHAAYLSMGR